MKARMLSEEGISRFQQYLDSQGSNHPELFDLALIDSVSTIVGGEMEVPLTCPSESRFEVAAFLTDLVDDSNMDAAYSNRGFWCWIAWVWFESIVQHEEGVPIVRENARWMLDQEYTRYYRHLLAGPWWIYQAHRDDPERAKSLLFTRVVSPGELVAQLAAYQSLISNPAIVGAATRLYFTGSALKSGHASKDAGGSARRLVAVLSHLDLVYDLQSMTEGEVFELLPKEFDKFK